MKLKYIGLVAGALLVLGLGSARADGMLELRVGAGINGTSPDDLSDQVSTPGFDFDNSDNFNLDLFWNIPGPFNVGIRGEWLNTDGSGGGVDGSIEASNVSLMVDFRFLDNWIYLGPIAGVGYPTGKIKFNGSDENLDTGNPTVTLGLESGLKFGRFMVGAELGYTSLRLETQDGMTSVDLSGMYGKVLAGIALF